MAPADTLSPPGSSSYSSDTMVVGDGTWDFTKNTFLLPNLVGVNFDTMRYNGRSTKTPLSADDSRSHILTSLSANKKAWAIDSRP